MKTKKHIIKKKHHTNDDLLYAIGSSVAATALVMIIMFSMVLCSFRYSFKRYYNNALLQVESRYESQFNGLKEELNALREKIDEPTPQGPESGDSPQIVQ